MSTAKDGVELQPHGSKHMTLGYYGVSAWLTQGKTAVEVKQGSLNLASAAYLPRKDRLRGEKEKKKWEQTRRLFIMIRSAISNSQEQNFQDYYYY